LQHFKAIELDAQSRHRTGREFVLEADTRQIAIERLLELLGKTAQEVRVDPTRTLIQDGDHLWSLIGGSAAANQESASLRRGGAKHKRVP
jgi:hypothetical protein